MSESFSIQNRRYLGNKFKLSDFIYNTIVENCPNITSVADIFSGTGSVASLFKDKTIITNDLLYSNYISNYAWFSSEYYDKSKVRSLLNYYNSISCSSDNYMSLTFSDTYFNRETCCKIGFIREDIENRYLAREINKREYSILITSLLYAMDKIANTCGHYDAYLKNNTKTNSELILKELDLFDNKSDNMCFNCNANDLVKTLSCDLVYIDPPYNSRQYCDAYHLLENVATWGKPEVKGIAKKMDRSALKSKYCTKEAVKEFEDLITHIKAKYIVVSYNDTGDTCNARSNAKLTDKELMSILCKRGVVKVIEKKHKAFTTGKSQNRYVNERLFICYCNNKEITQNNLIVSPLNYTGGKGKLLKQIIPLFPQDINTFYDLFCGGCNVGININANNVIFNDINKTLIGLFEFLRETDTQKLIHNLNREIEKYKLSNTKEKGYEFYNTNSSVGLANINKKAFNMLRNDFNNISLNSNNRDYYYTLFYLLIVFSFNNQIRFNTRHKFNLPVGKRDLNQNMLDKLVVFCNRLKNIACSFDSKSFKCFEPNMFAKNDFVYIDPPYLITCATYNENGGWNENLEEELLNYLTDLNNKGVKFALSNVLISKGKENELLKSWSKSFNTYHLNYNYNNSNYQTKVDGNYTDEVLITNYDIKGNLLNERKKC